MSSFTSHVDNSFSPELTWCCFRIEGCQLIGNYYLNFIMHSTNNRLMIFFSFAPTMPQVTFCPSRAPSLFSLLKLCLKSFICLDYAGCPKCDLIVPQLCPNCICPRKVNFVPQVCLARFPNCSLLKVNIRSEVPM